MTTSIRCVIFDWAGTTIDYGCLAPSGAFVAAFRQYGIECSLREVRGPMGLHKKDHIRELLRDAEFSARFESARGRGWTEADVVELYRIVTPMQVEAAAKYAQLVPGLNAVVAELRELGLKIAGSTGYFREAAEVCTTGAAAQGYVPDFSICADEVPAGRPAPWMIFRVMEALNVYPPSAVVKVGDTVVDIHDGLNAGVHSVAVIDSSSEMGLSLAEFEALPQAEREQRRSTVRAKFVAAGATAVLNSLNDLPAWLRMLKQ